MLKVKSYANNYNVYRQTISSSFSVAMQNQQSLHLLSAFTSTKGPSVCVCTDRPEVYPPSLKPTTDSTQSFGGDAGKQPASAHCAVSHPGN